MSGCLDGRHVALPVCNGLSVSVSLSVCLYLRLSVGVSDMTMISVVICLDTASSIDSIMSSISTMLLWGDEPCCYLSLAVMKPHHALAA